MEQKRYDKLDETVFHGVLPNGLHIYVDVRPEFTKKYAFFASNYGGKDVSFTHEGRQQLTPTGVAHFLEHKMFDMPEGNALQNLSANGASPNAYTSGDVTAYHFECTDHFEENLKTLLSFVSTPYFLQESVDKEQGIIGQEIRMGEDDPFWIAYYELLASLYHNHPIKTSIIGTVETIGEITAETLYECHAAFYNPANMCLCVAGNIAPEMVAAIAAEIVQADGSPPPVRDYGEPEPPHVVRQDAAVHMDVSTPLFLMGVKLEGGGDGDALLKKLLIAGLMSEAVFGKSSPLYTMLYEEGAINASFAFEHEVLPDYAMLLLMGEGGDPRRVREAILHEAARIADEGIELERWARLLKAEYGSYVRGLNGLESVCRNLSAGHMYGYDYLRFPQVFKTLTKAEVEAAIARFLTADCCALTVVTAKEGA